MKGNFDCTQFITFDFNHKADITHYMDNFKMLGFKVIPIEDIRQIKKDYFKDYFYSQVYELESDNFLGYLDEWYQIENPPKLVLDFANILYKMIKSSAVDNFRVILSSFAEEELSVNDTIEVEVHYILNGLFYMSSNNFEAWTDNLIIDINDF